VFVRLSQNNHLDSFCQANIVGTQSWGNCFGNGCYGNILDDGEVENGHYIQNYQIANSISDTEISIVRGLNCQTKVAYNSNGDVKVYCEADLIA
jgi:hypothetical protein